MLDSGKKVHVFLFSGHKYFRKNIPTKYISSIDYRNRLMLMFLLVVGVSIDYRDMLDGLQFFSIFKKPVLEKNFTSALPN